MDRHHDPQLKQRIEAPTPTSSAQISHAPPQLEAIQYRVLNRALFYEIRSDAQKRKFRMKTSSCCFQKKRCPG
jgi:hypothetical protein